MRVVHDKACRAHPSAYRAALRPRPTARRCVSTTRPQSRRAGPKRSVRLGVCQAAGVQRCPRADRADQHAASQPHAVPHRLGPPVRRRYAQPQPRHRDPSRPAQLIGALAANIVAVTPLACPSLPGFPFANRNTDAAMRCRMTIGAPDAPPQSSHPHHSVRQRRPCPTHRRAPQSARRRPQHCPAALLLRQHHRELVHADERLRAASRHALRRVRAGQRIVLREAMPWPRALGMAQPRRHDAITSASLAMAGTMAIPLGTAWPSRVASASLPPCRSANGSAAATGRAAQAW